MVNARGFVWLETHAEPDPVDVYVGRTIRLRRKTCRMSQTELGQACGVSCQQVQKYERAANRVSTSMLARISKALDHPIVMFFPPQLIAERFEGCATTVNLDPASAQMVALYGALERRQQDAINGLLEAMAAANSPPPARAARPARERQAFMGPPPRKPRAPQRTH